MILSHCSQINARNPHVKTPLGRDGGRSGRVAHDGQMASPLTLLSVPTSEHLPLYLKAMQG